MTPEYYRLVRFEIESLLPAAAARILDVGCGVGATSAWLKRKYPGCHTIGIERNAALLDELSDNVDEPLILDLNGDLPEAAPVDLVLMLDVLEHLNEPEAVLRRIVTMMSEDATAIISLPNVAHLSVAFRLLLLGRFDYTDAGILDRTHIRFFYKGSALELAGRAGLRVERGLMVGPRGSKSRWIDRLSFGLIRDRLTKQYIFAARRGSGRSAVDWRPA
jgi:SAM-dependent methyltransferase